MLLLFGTLTGIKSLIFKSLKIHPFLVYVTLKDTSLNLAIVNMILHDFILNLDDFISIFLDRLNFIICSIKSHIFIIIMIKNNIISNNI